MTVPEMWDYFVQRPEVNTLFFWDGGRATRDPNGFTLWSMIDRSVNPKDIQFGVDGSYVVDGDYLHEVCYSEKGQDVHKILA